MAGNIYRRAIPGEPLNIPAELWNRVTDQVQGLDLSGQGGGPVITSRSATYCKVKNDSGAARDRFNILGIDDVVITPTEANLVEFQRQAFFSGITPTLPAHTFRYVVLLEPLADEAIGWACMAGVVPVKITGADQGKAQVIAADTGKMLANGSGTAKVLWADSGSAERWALVMLGDADEIAFLRVTSVTQTAGAYPATRYDLDASANPQAWTAAESCWVKTPNGEILCVGTTKEWPAKLVGVKASDSLFIYEALNFVRFAKGTLAGALAFNSSATVTLSDGQTVTSYDGMLNSGDTDVASGTKVYVAWNDILDRFEVVNASCP